MSGAEKPVAAPVQPTVDAAYSPFTRYDIEVPLQNPPLGPEVLGLSVGSEMKVQFVNPFIESVCHLFVSMLGCEARRGEIGVTQEIGYPRDITALIGLSGAARGTVAISFPVSTALAVVSRLLGTSTRVVDDTVLDTVAELVNIVAGGARAKFAQEEGETLLLSLPTVVRGQRHTLTSPSECAWLEVPFTSDLGAFSLRVTVEDSVAGHSDGKEASPA